MANYDRSLNIKQITKFQVLCNQLNNTHFRVALYGALTQAYLGASASAWLNQAQQPPSPEFTLQS